MRYNELIKKDRNKLLAQDAAKKADLLALMYADYDYINRDKNLVLAEIERKILELEQLKDELVLLIDKAEIDFEMKESVRQLAQKRIQKIMKG